MKVRVKGAIRDLLAFRGLAATRRKRIERSSRDPMPRDAVGALARRLHPAKQHLVISDVCDETRSAKSFRLVPDTELGTERVAHFRAGQYLSVKADVNGTRVTRPYSISSGPCEAVGADGGYEITVRKKDGGFVTDHIWAKWGEGTKVTTSGPAGFFYYEPMRDRPSIVGVAGGSGITPFRSMAREIVHGDLNVDLTLLYGSSDEDDIIYFDELQALEAASVGRLRVVHVLSCDEISLPGCEQGFISAGTIGKHADIQECSIFVCVPQAMYRYVADELNAFGLPRRRIRREAYGEMDSALEDPSFPAELVEAEFSLGVQMGSATYKVPARAAETILVAFERANLATPSQCRSGECGFCRSLLVAGDVHVLRDTDGRRAADREYGYIHPCATYPLSNLELVVPRDV